jgi:hypothetical protein
MNRDFKGIWIPANIWLDKNLKIIEKVMLVEINSLDNKDGCYANNYYFAEFFDLSKNRVSEILKTLEEKKYIAVDRTGKRVIKINKEKLYGVRDSDSRVRDSEGGFEISTKGFGKSKHNNTNNNTINNINNNNTVEKLFDLKKDKDKNNKEKESKSPYERGFYSKLVEAWNEIFEKPHIRMTNNRKKHINARSNILPTLNDWEQYFLMIKSDLFLVNSLKGNNPKWKGCNFDWFVKEGNMVKTIERMENKGFKIGEMNKNENQRNSDDSFFGESAEIEI